MQDVGYRYAFQTAFLAEHLFDGCDEDDPWDDYLEVHDEAMAQHDAEVYYAEFDPSLGTLPFVEDVDEDSLRSDCDGR